MEEFTRSGIDPLTVSLYQMDLDRTLFLLRSYLRTRLQKVTMNTALFILYYSVLEVSPPPTPNNHKIVFFRLLSEEAKHIWAVNVLNFEMARTYKATCKLTT